MDELMNQDPVEMESSEDAAPAAERDPNPPAPNAIEQDVIAALKNCYDPEIPVNIYELGLIYDIKIDPQGAAAITMTLTAPNCPAAQSMPLDVQTKVEAVEGIKSAKVDVVFDPPWTPEKMDDSAKLALNIL
jgi:FeS assembly SUF system protein